jgi:hypothetical protein
MGKLINYVVYFRKKNANNDHSTFVLNNFKEFKSFLKEHLVFFEKYLDIRHLICIIDTYTDYGNDREKYIASIINMFAFEERMVNVMDIHFNNITPRNYQNAFTKYSFGSGDALRNFFNRMNKIISDDEILHRLFKAICRWIILYNTTNLHNILTKTHEKERKFVMSLLT